MQNTPQAASGTDLAVSRKSVVAASFGNAMEWYDFSVYAFFATFIGANFFEKGDPGHAMIQTFMVFGAGFIARPLGSLVLGALGDRRGRKPALLVSLFTMALGVLIIAVTPPTASIGLAAPLLLLMGRLLQGFSAGGELGSAASYLLENAPEDRKAGYAAWLQGSMGISNLLAALAGLLVTTVYPHEEVMAWAWRLPFFFGLLLVPVGLYIRGRLPETQDFREEVATTSWKQTFRVLFAENLPAVLLGFVFCILWNVAVSAVIIFGPTYYQTASGLHFTAQESFLAQLIGNVFFVCMCIIAGRQADVVGRRRMLMFASLGLFFLPVAGLFALQHWPNILALFVGVAPSTLPMVFPAQVRSTGVSVTYNTAAMIFAAYTPALLSWADQKISVYSPALLIAVAALLTMGCLPALFRRLRAVEADHHLR